MRTLLFITSIFILNRISEMSERGRGRGRSRPRGVVEVLAEVVEEVVEEVVAEADIIRMIKMLELTEDQLQLYQYHYLHLK